MKTIFCIFLFGVLSTKAQAATAVDTNKFWSEARFFVTSNQLATAPDNLNALTSPDSVQALSTLTGFGLEGNFNVARFMKAGLRAGGRWNKQGSTIPTNNNAYLAVQQGWGGGVLRFPLVRSDILQLDLFGEGGLAVTHIDISTQSSGSGTFTKNFNPYSRAGLSIGVGYSTFYIFAEGGYQWEKLDTMSYSGTLATSISSFDLSGTYLAAGFIINGVPGFLHK